MKTTSGGGGGVGAAESDNRTATVGIEFTKDKNGISLLVLRNHRGASATVSLHGGQVLSWKTELGEDQSFSPPKAVRGGIPICFPQFGNRGTLEQHGFARNKIWIIEQNLPLLPGDFNGKGLFGNRWQSNLTSRIRNVNGKNFSFSMAYHTYFSISDIIYKYIRTFTEQGDSLAFVSEVDRVYFDFSNIVIVLDHEKKRTFVIRKEGLPDVVVWNPWERKSKSILDLGDEEYKQMLCVDGAAVEKPNHLVAR
ncbi:hypothetical protein AAZX31_11G018800 [Glycine max]